MKALICEGGGFKTAFTAGVLDAWIASNYHPFDIFIGVSGGAVIMSSYISKQYKRGWELEHALHTNPSLTSIRRAIKGGYYLELDIIEQIWDNITPFDYATANNAANKIIEFSCTNLQTGDPVYISPKEYQWKRYLRATSTLPLVAQCPFMLEELPLVDGAFGAPVPVQRAIELGATDITVIRVNPGDILGSRLNKVVSNYLLKNKYPAIDYLMQHEEAVYRAVVDIMDAPPEGVTIKRILPKQIQSGILSTKMKMLEQDYRLGLEQGLDFLHQL